jgi:hypothetical protein
MTSRSEMGFVSQLIDHVTQEQFATTYLSEMCGCLLYSEEPEKCFGIHTE